MMNFSAEALRKYFGQWTDVTSMITLRDANAKCAAEYQRNADKMVEIVRVMDEEIARRSNDTI